MRIHVQDDDAWCVRSAKRSIPAAKAATAEGYIAYNISFGFMGVLDKATGEQPTPHTSHLTRHTSHITPHAGQYHGGWISDPALPWRQDII